MTKAIRFEEGRTYYGLSERGTKLEYTVQKVTPKFVTLLSGMSTAIPPMRLRYSDASGVEIAVDEITPATNYTIRADKPVDAEFVPVATERTKIARELTAEQKDRAKTTRMLRKYASETSWILRLYRDVMAYKTDEEYEAELGVEATPRRKVECYLFSADAPDGTPEFANCFDYARGLNLPERVWDDESESIPMIADIVARIGERLTEETIQSEKTQVLQVEEPKTTETPAEQAKECGHAILALKGNAKAQAAKLEEYGEEFLDSMLYVFYKPMKVKTESEIRKWMCRDILRCARDKEYAVSKRESVRCTINNLTYHLSWWNEADRKEEELKIEHLKGWYEFLGEYTGKEEEAMTQTHAVEAIRTADTVETISGALLKSGKVKDMCAAFEETVGERYYGKTIGINKEELAWNMALQIMCRRENEAFKMLSFTEKCKRLSEIDPFDAPRYVYQCEMDDLKRIANMLGVEADYDGENILQAKMSYEDAIVNVLLRHAKNRKHSTETSQPEALYEDDVYADDGGDNSAQEQDIPEAHIPEAHESEEIPATVIDVSAGVENYECEKLTAEELAEILDRAPAEVLREYILQVIVKDPPEVIKIPA